jgi:hypothetical protein
MMGGNAVHRHHLRPQTACYHSLHTSKMSLNTQTSGASFQQACPLAHILCSPPPSQAAAAPLRQILRSAAPSPRNEGAANAAPLSQILCSPPPSRSPAAAAPLSQILRSAAPSPIPQTTPAPPPPPVLERHRTPPPKRGPKRKAPENIHVNPESLHVKTQKRFGCESGMVTARRINGRTGSATQTAARPWCWPSG